MGFFSRKTPSNKAYNHASSKPARLSVLRAHFHHRRHASANKELHAQVPSAVDATVASPVNAAHADEVRVPHSKSATDPMPPPQCRFLLTARKLGSGAYGAVVEGLDLAIPHGHGVAIKLIPEGRMKSTSLEREIHILRRLSDVGHPTHLKFIAHCPPAAVESGVVHPATGAKALPLPLLHNKPVPLGACHALVMEAARGGEIFDHVIRVDGMLEARSGPVFAQLADSVRAAHALGIVHRDLKLENVLLCGREGEPDCHSIKLIDWGLAHQHQLTSEGEAVPEMLRSRCGSRSYMSPEVTNREHCSKVGYDGFAADVWSLGVCLFAMHLGFFPFEHADPSVDWRARKVVEAQEAGRSGMKTILGFYPPNKQSARMSAPLIALLDRMLVFDPQQRATLHEVLDSAWLAPHLFACRAPGGCLDRVSLSASRPCLTATSGDSTMQSFESDLGSGWAPIASDVGSVSRSSGHDLWVATESGLLLQQAPPEGSSVLRRLHEMSARSGSLSVAPSASSTVTATSTATAATSSASSSSQLIRTHRRPIVAPPAHMPPTYAPNVPQPNVRHASLGQESYPNVVVAGVKERPRVSLNLKQPMPTEQAERRRQQQTAQDLAALLSKACKVSRSGSPRRPDRGTPAGMPSAGFQSALDSIVSAATAAAAERV